MKVRGDAVEQGTGRGVGVDEDVGAGVVAVMRVAGCTAPTRRSAEGEFTEGVPFFQFVAFRIMKRVRGRAKTDNWPARFQIILDAPDLIGGQQSPAQKENGEVGVCESFEAGNVFFVVFVALAFLVRGEEDGRAEAVIFFQFLRQQRHGALGAVFVVAGDEDDVGLLFFRRSAGERQRAGEQQ